MVSAEFGQKHRCFSCGMKFYDFKKSPIICPGCGSEFDPENLLKSRRGKSAAKPVVEKAASVASVETELEEELVSDEDDEFSEADTVSDGDDLTAAGDEDENEAFISVVGDDDDNNDSVTDLGDGDLIDVLDDDAEDDEVEE